MTSVISLFDYPEIKFLYKTKKTDLGVLLITMIGSLFISK